MRPPPQNLTVAEPLDVLHGRFGQQHHVGDGDDLVVREHAGDQRREVAVAYAVPVAVSLLEVDVGAQVFVDPLDVCGVDRQAFLVLFVRGTQNAKGEQAHARPPFVVSTP